MTHANAKIREMLEKIEFSADEGRSRLVYVGRALGRSEENLQMATASGVVLIPLEEIEDLHQIAPGFRDDLLRVTVRNATLVRHVFRREQLKESGVRPQAAEEVYSPYIDAHFHGLDHGTVTHGTETDACDATDVCM